MKEKDNKTSIVHVRVTPDEKEMIRELASEEDLSMGRFIMKLAREKKRQKATGETENER